MQNIHLTILGIALIGIHNSAAVEFVLVAPSTPAVAGSNLTVTLYLHNFSSREAPVQMPQPLKARITSSETASKVVLMLVPSASAPERVAARSFERISLTASLPLAPHGVVSMELIDLAANPVMFQVWPAPAALATPETIATPTLVKGPKSQRPAAPDERPKLSTYEPVYFSVGTRGFVNAKFQISAKFRFFDTDDWVGRRVSFADELHLGYTQTSLWDLESPSAPFHDSSYRPAVFYYKEDLGWKLPGMSRLGLQFGPEHESNGKGGDDSRSINILFLRPWMEFGDLEGYHLTVAPKAYLYLEKSDNPDIDRYRGYFDLMAKYGKKDGFMVSVTGRVGYDLDHGSVQVDASYPLLKSRYGPFLHFQYFAGSGETILDYNVKFRSQVRLGLMLVR